MQSTDRDIFLQLLASIEKLQNDVSDLKQQQQQQQKKRSRTQLENDEMERFVPPPQYSLHDVQEKLKTSEKCQTSGFEITLQTCAPIFYHDYW